MKPSPHKAVKAWASIKNGKIEWCDNVKCLNKTYCIHTEPLTKHFQLVEIRIMPTKKKRGKNE